MDTVTLADLGKNEVRILRRALKRLAYESKKAHRRSMETGWTPEPGKADINLLTLETVKSLLDRLPYPDYPVDLNQGDIP